jgi:hypothetical protein
MAFLDFAQAFYPFHTKQAMKNLAKALNKKAPAFLTGAFIFSKTILPNFRS